MINRYLWGFILEECYPLSFLLIIFGSLAISYRGLPWVIESLIVLIKVSQWIIWIIAIFLRRYWDEGWWHRQGCCILFPNLNFTLKWGLISFILPALSLPSPSLTLDSAAIPIINHPSSSRFPSQLQLAFSRYSRYSDQSLASASRSPHILLYQLRKEYTDIYYLSILTPKSHIFMRIRRSFLGDRIFFGFIYPWNRSDAWEYLTCFLLTLYC